MRDVLHLQENVAMLAAMLDLQADALLRWARAIDGARYSAGDDEPQNLEARLESSWIHHADDLRDLGRHLRTSSALPRP